MDGVFFRPTKRPSGGGKVSGLEDKASMRVRRATYVVSLIMLCSPSIAMQEPPRAVGHGVRLIVAVSDGGRPLTGLTAAQFQLWDNGVQQEIQGVTAVGGLAVVLIVD